MRRYNLSKNREEPKATGIELAASMPARFRSRTPS
eukprot:gene25935-biopygen11935